MVELKIQVPESVAQQLGSTPEAAARRLLEKAAVEGYRSGELSRWQVRQMLQLSWHANEEFLAKNNCYRDYTVEDLEHDRQVLEKLLGPK